MKMLGLTVAVLLGLCAWLWFQITQPLILQVPSRASVGVEPAQLRQHVEIISRDFFPRDEGHSEILSELADYIQAQFKDAGAETERQSFTVNGRTYHNVIAAYGPETEDRIIVGAHYDAAGELPAADDNASGVAALLALATLLRDARLPRRVELVAYTLEEPPYYRSRHMGSAMHVRLLEEQGARVRMMFSLEMIGYFSDEPGSQQYPLPMLRWFYPDQGNFIAVIGRFLAGHGVRTVKRAMRGASDLPVYSLNAPSVVPGVDFSDHYNFWKAGHPAVMITDTAFYRYDGYHSPYDTPDRLDYGRMAKVVQGVYAAVLALADGSDG